MARSSIERRLHDVTERLKRVRAEVEVLNEQLQVLTEQADESRLRAVVSESFDAERVGREDQKHADAMRRSRDDLVATIADLERQQNDLLDRLVVDPR